MSWSAAQYTKFEDERTRPVRDLIAQIGAPLITRAADIGCGPGNSTELLQARFPEASVVGIDSSQDMIEAARKRLPEISFETANIAHWTPPVKFDVILANAVLQWLPDHARLMPALVEHLDPGGTLAVQMPDNLDEPAHVLMREVAAEQPWAAKLAAAAHSRAPRHATEWYFSTLRPHVSHIDVWRTTYHHLLSGGPAAVVEWFKGSALRPLLDPLDAGEREDFLTRYTARVAEAYPALADGTVLLPFPRLFFVAVR